MKDTWNIH